MTGSPLTARRREQPESRAARPSTVPTGAVRQELLREARLVPPPDWEPPALDDLVPDVHPGPPAQESFTIAYYDTADQALTRAGITVRYEKDAVEPEWTVQLPAAPTVSRLIRRTLRLPGTAEAVPEKALDVLRARIRGRPLRQVAELSTARRVVALHDRGDTVLANVVDDDVTATADGGRQLRVREVKIDVKDLDRSGSRLFRAVNDALVASGCRPAPPTAKLTRVLGIAPDRLLGAIDAREPVATMVGQVLMRSLDRLLACDAQLRFGGDAEDLSDYCASVARLRADLQTFAELLDDDWAQRLAGELSWVAGAAASVHDATAIRALLTTHVRRDLAGEDRPSGLRLLARLDQQRDDAEQTLLAALRSDRYDALLEALDDGCRQPRLASSAWARQLATLPAGELMTHLMRRASRRLRRSLQRCGHRPSDAELRRVHRAAERAQHIADAAVPVLGTAAVRVVESATRLQRPLLRHRNAAAAEAWLRTAARTDVEDALAAGALINSVRRDREQVRSRWPGGSP
ncbi:MAG TPA: CYTH and CHAD domain-containing protein [Jatrophihabitans sp.]|nr:CYTH and CHAD domain-containing protein [Jatrophihabitans sp.]